jgi:hypothetical protein
VSGSRLYWGGRVSRQSRLAVGRHNIDPSVSISPNPITARA